MRNGPGLQQVTTQELAAHRARVLGANDAIYNPLFDSANYPAAGTTQLNFFSSNIGVGTTTAPGATGAKTEADTNMTNASSLPAFTRFYCTGIEVQVIPGLNPGRGGALDASAGNFVNDVFAIGKAGWLKFFVGQRVYCLDGPLWNFTSTAGLGGFAAVTSATTAAASLYSEIGYARFVGQAYTIVPVYLEANQNFGVQLNWPAAIATPSTQIARIFVRLRGRLIRAAQ